MLDLVKGNEVVQSAYVNPKFPNNFVMNFLYNFQLYLSNSIPRELKYKMITTYQKGIEHIHKQESKTNMYAQQYPAMIVQPGQLKLDDRVNAPWQSMNQMSETMMVNHFDPYVTLGNVAIYPVINRFIYSFEIHYLAESNLELIDVVLHMNRLFNNRYKHFEDIGKGQLYLPDDLIAYLIKEYTEDILSLSKDCSFVYTDTYNRSMYAIPWNFNAHIKLLDYSDGSNFMGDQELPTFRTTFSFEALLSIPNHLVNVYNPTFEVFSFEFNIANNSANKPVYYLDNSHVHKEHQEVILLHIVDFDTSCTVNLPKSSIASNFVEFWGVKTHILSNIKTRLTDAEFNMSEDLVNRTFTITNVDSELYFVDILGRYI